MNHRPTDALRQLNSVKGPAKMSRNGLYVLVGILLIALIGVGVYAYQQQQRPALEIKLDNNGLKINGGG